MDTRISRLGYASNGFSRNSFGLCNKVQAGNEDKTDVTLQLDSPTSSCLYGFINNGTKRSWTYMNEIEGPEYPLLALGMRQSSSSSDISKMSLTTVSTVSSVKDTDEGSSINLDLNFNFSNGSTCFPQKPSSSDAKSSGSMFDLKLSITTRPSESAITCEMPLLNRDQNRLETSVVVCPVPSNNEVGLASSCLILGRVLAPSDHILDSSSSFLCTKKISTKTDGVELTPHPPSAMAKKWKRPVACTSGFTNPQHLKGSTKKCQFQGCEKRARGASGFCISHGGGRRCQKPDCQKGAEGSTIFCKAHGGGQRCEFLGCTKSAEGRTNYCIGHGGGRRCSQEGCSHAARGKSGFCIKHGGGKRCQMENCTKSAEGYSGFCISHGGGRRCHFPACSKGAQGSTPFCKAHGGGKRCTFLGCTKGAEGSTPFCKGHGGGKRCSFQGEGVCPKSVHGGTQFCIAHGGGKRCAVPECTKSARGRTNFCVCHGGGKRCKFEGCAKSAQGSTDFCKAHGGGKHCSWGQVSSNFGVGEPECDKLARSKSGLCAAHSALVQDCCVRGGTLGPSAIQYATSDEPQKTKEDAYSLSKVDIGHSSFDRERFMNPPSIALVSLSEGRVHGGSLVALLASTSCVDDGLHIQADTGSSKEGASHGNMHHWI